MRKILLASSALCALALAGCDDPAPKEPDAAKAAPAAPVSFDNNANRMDDANTRLLQAIRTKAVEGGKLVVRPEVLVFELDREGTRQETVRVTNEGDSAVQILTLIATTQQRGLTLDGDCAAKPKIAPGTSCDLVIRYTDQTGRSLDSSVLLTTDSPRTPQINIPVSVDVLQKAGDATEQAPAPAATTPKPNGGQPRPGAAAPAPVPVPTSVPAPAARNTDQLARDAAHARALNAARAAQSGGGGGFGRLIQTRDNGFATPQPEIVHKTTDQRYDPEAVAWTESSLPVDRKNILTADRVIKAVLETPITNVMCNQAVAVVEGNVYSPDHHNVLIPGGSRVIGKCQAFADERVNIQWERVLTPNGVNISFRNMMADSSDAGGRGGVPGKIEQRFVDRYILPMVSTSIDLLSAVARAAYGKDQTNSYDVDSGRETSGKSSADVALDEINSNVVPGVKKIIEDIADVRKVVVIPGGTRLDIVLQEDIYFKTPYQVVRLADVEYDVQRQVVGPKMLEQPAPAFNLNPRLGRPANAAETININGKTYVLQAAPPPQDNGGAPAQTEAPRYMAPAPNLLAPQNTTQPATTPSWTQGSQNVQPAPGSYQQRPR